MSLGMLIIYIIFLGIIFLIILTPFGTIYCDLCILICLVPLVFIIILATLFSSIVILILNIIMLAHYYRGYTTEFLDYYNKCMDSNQKTIFNSIYHKVNKLSKKFAIL